MEEKATLPLPLEAVETEGRRNRGEEEVVQGQHDMAAAGGCWIGRVGVRQKCSHEMLRLAQRRRATGTEDSLWIGVGPTSYS